MARKRPLGSKGKLNHYMSRLGSGCQPGASSSGECLPPTYSPEKAQPESNNSGDGGEATEDLQELTDEVVLVDDRQNNPPAIQHFRLSPPPMEEGETSL